MNWERVWRHAMTGQRRAHGLFSEEAMARLRAVIAEGEAAHRAEVRLIVESALPFRKVRRGLQARQRALDLFGTFRVWDTEENNGVLLYINIADRKLEIIADREAARRVGDPVWQTVCAVARQAFHGGEFERGVTEALGSIHAALVTAFPVEPGSARRNELDDLPIRL